MPDSQKVYVDPQTMVFSQLAIGDYFCFEGHMDQHKKITDETGETDTGREFGVGQNAKVVKRAETREDFANSVW